MENSASELCDKLYETLHGFDIIHLLFEDFDVSWKKFEDELRKVAQSEGSVNKIHKTHYILKDMIEAYNRLPSSNRIEKFSQARTGKDLVRFIGKRVESVIKFNSKRDTTDLMNFSAHWQNEHSQVLEEENAITNFLELFKDGLVCQIKLNNWIKT